MAINGVMTRIMLPLQCEEDYKFIIEVL